MLSCNLWVQSGIVNGALGVVIHIVYTPRFSPPKFLAYVAVEFDNYIGPPWDQCQPKHIPIPSLQRSNRKQIPLKMAWELTIHSPKAWH